MQTNESSRAHRPLSNEYLLYLLRHGIAVARGAPGFSEDSRRPLTPEGKVRMREIAAGLRRLGVSLDWIVTSPLVRAVETAEIVAESFEHHIPLDFCDALRPGSTPEALLTFLGKHRERREVMVVGHEPDLSMLACRLIGAGRHTGLALKKGGGGLIAFSSFPPRTAGELRLLLTPKVLRKLA